MKKFIGFIPSFDGCSILTLGDTNIICVVESSLIDKKISNTTLNPKKEENYNFLGFE